MSSDLRKPLRPILLIVAIVVLLASTTPARTFALTVEGQISEPEIGARSAIVVEYPGGRILYARAMHDRLAPASTTKIMTSILALEHGNVEETVTISPDDLVGESSMGLMAGEIQTIHNLLYGMLLPSGNDAAMAVARHLGSLAPAGGDPSKSPITRFAEMMNARAEQLGLQDSHFVNPHGLDTDGHYSSAYDLASLTWYAFQFPLFNEIVKQPFYEAPGHSLRNTNEMLTRYDGTDGVKTGWTDAGGLCLVTSATRDGHRLISVVLNAPLWYKDSAAILDYGFAKLAAEPQDAGAEVLSVAKRGTAAWLMANATSTPPIPAAPPASLAQGGGTAASSAQVAVNSGEQPAGNTATGAGGAGGGPGGGQFALAATSSGKGSSLPSGIFIGLIMLALAAGIVWWFFGRPGGFAGFRVRRPFAASTESLQVARHTSNPVRAYMAPAPVLRPTSRTLGVAPARQRREPNLLLSKDEITLDHIERAVELAAQGRQGSSMAEFLLAMRSGDALVVEEIDGRYELDSAGFLALSRAQAAAGLVDGARATLTYATAALPGDRVLRLAQRQLTSH